MRKDTAFTLIELIVGIVIIIILAAFLVPAMRGAIFSNADARCAANLRIIVLAGQMFAQDHQGEFTDNNYFNSRYDVDADKDGELDGRLGMREYVEYYAKRNGVDTVFTCPVLQKLYPTTGFNFNHNYAVNKQTTSKGALKRWQNVQSLAATSYFMEGVPASQDHRGYYFSTEYTFNSVGSFIYPHRGQQTVVYLDGHVARVSNAELQALSNEAVFWTGVEPR